MWNLLPHVSSVDHTPMVFQCSLYVFKETGHGEYCLRSACPTDSVTQGACGAWVMIYHV